MDIFLIVVSNTNINSFKVAIEKKPTLGDHDSEIEYNFFI